MTLAVLAFAAVLSAAAEPASKVLALKKGDIVIEGCSRPSTMDPNVCYWGSHTRAGCEGDCGDAVIPNTVSLAFACGYRLSGTVREARSGKPRAALPIDFVIAGRARFRARTDEAGAFSLDVPPKSRSSKCRETKDFGSMEVEADTPKILLIGSLSEKLRKAHPELKLTFLKAAEIAAEGVDLSP